MSSMTYKGYRAHVAFDHRDDVFVGRLVGIADIVSFRGTTVAELRRAFEQAVGDYLETCAKAGKAAERPVSGKIMLRVPPEVHRAALVSAEASGTSLNRWARWATRVLSEAASAP